MSGVPHWLVVIGLLSLGCQEIGIDKLTEPVPEAEQDDPAAPIDTDATTGGEVDTTTTPDEVPEQPFQLPPNELEGDCDGGITAQWQSGELQRWGHDDDPIQGTLTASGTGWFHVYDDHAAESGGSQRNESYYLRIPTTLNPTGQPLEGNCHGDWVSLDADNDGPPPGRRYLGTFHLEAGDNTVDIHHFCGSYRDGLCGELHDIHDERSTCETSNPNSIHFTGSALCLMEAAPAIRPAPEPLPMDCSDIARAPERHLCSAGPTGCAAVYTDSSSCNAVCASVGLSCVAAFDNIDGTCSRDPNAAQLSCNTGHQSDYCVCR